MKKVILTAESFKLGKNQIDRMVYLCPCEKGRIIEEIETNSAGKNHQIVIACDKCKKEYVVNRSKDGWDLKKINK